MTKPIRVVIAEDDTIVRAGVRLLLDAQPGIEVVGEAADGQQAIEQAGQLRPDVILMDIAMPGTNGLEATRVITERYPESQILVLTMHRSEAYFYEALRAGALGYLLKGAETSDLIEAIRTVAGGEVFMQPGMVRNLVQGYLESARKQELDESRPLTTREREVLSLLAEGYSTKEIANRLFVSSSTIQTHRANLMRKLGFSKRHELVQYAREQGILPPA